MSLGLLAEDLTTEPIVYKDFEVVIPQGAGFGVDIDPEKVAKFRRQ